MCDLDREGGVGGARKRREIDNILSDGDDRASGSLGAEGDQGSLTKNEGEVDVGIVFRDISITNERNERKMVQRNFLTSIFYSELIHVCLCVLV